MQTAPEHSGIARAGPECVRCAREDLVDLVWCHPSRGGLIAPLRAPESVALGADGREPPAGFRCVDRAVPGEVQDRPLRSVQPGDLRLVDAGLPPPLGKLGL
ncbi:MAG TPA: hypothetical protein PLQ87_05350 [Phycisphaerae bacterium]|nr:hypothetical protein [Phycisphaerae bacterium]